MLGNPFLSGAALGLLMPAVAHILTKYTSLPFLIGSKPLGLYVIAALINLLLVRYFYRNGREPMARGVILITFALVLLLIFTTKLSFV